MKVLNMFMFMVIWVIGCAIASFFPKDLNLAWMMLWGFAVGGIAQLLCF